jgi:hypothetical protein
LIVSLVACAITTTIHGFHGFHSGANIFIYYLSETFEDANRVISGRKSKEISENVKETNNDLNRKLMFEHKKPGVDSCAPEG